MLSFQFALKIIQLVKVLREAKEYVFADQILRSVTSIGANVAEASAGQSKKDSISKMAIASREARYWLRLLDQGNLVKIDLSDHLDEINQIIKILTKIVKTSQLKT